MDGPLVACSMAKCCHVSYTTIEIQLFAVKSVRMVYAALLIVLVFCH